MNLSKYPTLIRDIPTEQPIEPRTAAQDMAAGETFYGDEWLSPEKLRAIRKAQEDAAAEMFAALIALEDAEAFNANCEECEGHGIPELCPACFPLFDDARVKRRAALAKAIAEREIDRSSRVTGAAGGGPP